MPNIAKLFKNTLYNPWQNLPCWTASCISENRQNMFNPDHEINLNGAGEPKIGTCLEHQSNECQKRGCRSGYHFNNITNECDVNICTCANGAAELGPSIIQGGGCVVHGNEKCLVDHCFRGYHYDYESRSCVRNTCYEKYYSSGGH